MLGRALLLIFSLSIVYAVNAFAETVSTVWTIGKNPDNTLTLVNDVNAPSAEVILLKMNRKKRTVKVNADDTYGDSYSGNYYVTDAKGAVIEDFSIATNFGDSYKIILGRLKEKEFRATFKEIPESCPKKANGFLIITNTLKDGEASGYCLTPVAQH